MSSILPQGGEQDLIQDIIHYPLKTIQYLQGRQQRIPKITPKSPNIYFIHLSPQAFQFCSIPKSTINHLSTEQQLSFSQILKNSTIVDTIEYEDISKLDKKPHRVGTVMHFLVGVYESGKDVPDKGKASMVLRLGSEEAMNGFFQEANRKLKDEREYMKKSTTNFVGIEENIRKIVEKILISSYPKRELYNRIMTKLGEKKLVLTLEQNKMMVYALIGNHPEMQNFLRKQKIQAYDIEKKRYDDFLKEESLTNMAEIVEPGREHVIEGYSEKRKLDGIVVRRNVGNVGGGGQREQQKENGGTGNVILKNQEELYIGKIPQRTQLEISQLIGLQNDYSHMQTEQKIIKELPMSYRSQKVKIPHKEYTLLSKQVQRVQKDQPPTPDILDRSLLLSIQAVKFMYQLMHTNSKQKAMYGLMGEGPMEGVLDCLKDILTECQRRPEDKKLIENKSVIELLGKANRNYLDYRRNPNKFY